MITRTEHNQVFDINGDLIFEDVVERDITVEVNNAVLSDKAVLLAKLDEVKAFLVDPDVEYANNIANTTALTTQEQNRLNKALIRQARRNANLTIRLARYVFGQENPELLDDITDI
jgi:regulation of enolase protein 1 (concanavalin A-like superfamily)